MSRLENGNAKAALSPQPAEKELELLNPAQGSGEDALFEDLMLEVGNKGRFQKRFNILFNLVFTVFISMPYLNIVLALAVPDHWCHVPGRELTNLSLREWKELTIPMKITEDGEEEFSQCTMFNVSTFEETDEMVHLLRSIQNKSAAEVVECRFGWEYDRTWYTETVPSQEDWVCNRTIYMSNVFAFSRAGDVLGSFIFGQIGDTVGRRPVYFITLVLLLLGRGLSVVTAGIYPLFLSMTVMGSATSSAAFQSPFTVGMEVSASDKRGHIAMLQCLGWTLGICIVPLAAWACGHWVWFMLITTLPCAPFLFVNKYFTESPRWLASQGRTERCRKGLKYIAQVNGTSLPPDTASILERIAERKEKVYGVASLFTSRRLTKHTALIAYTWFVNSITYYTLMLNVNFLAGNPFLNYFWQSLVELPGSIMGQWSSDRYGRRWTGAVCFFVLTFAYVALILTVNDSRINWLTTILVIFAKFCVTITFYVIYLQCMEIYPTCVRQTGTALASLIGSGLGILGPYILFLGEELDMRYSYIIMSFLAFTGTICSSFLPETLHQKLPETLADAHTFGQNQPYWQFRYSPRKAPS